MEEIERSRRAAAEFLLTEARLALTMVEIAATSSDANSRSRNIRNAQTALATIDRFLDALHLDSATVQQIQRAACAVYKELDRVLSEQKPERSRPR